MGSAVTIEGLVKEFRGSWKGKTLRAVDGVSLEIGEGEVYGLIGPNGSGKSTTMKALLGLVRPTSGVCTIFGKNSLMVDSREDVGFLPENPYFYKHLTGEETLAFYGRLCGLRGGRLRARMDELFALVGLEEARDRRVAGYSKGMLQRIGIAQALVQEPRLVILDEPTAGVDPVGSREIRDLIFALKSRGITVFLCSHLLEQVQEVCDRVGMIYRGKMVREGRLEELISLEDQWEMVVRGGRDGLSGELEELARNGGAELVRSGRPKTTLERLFFREIQERDEK